MTPPPVKKSKIERKYRKEWEKEDWAKGWLKSIADVPTASSVANGKLSAWCSVCKTSLYPQKKDLKKHINTDRHKRNMPALHSYTMRDYVEKAPDSASVIMDIKLAVFIAKHTSIATVDHLSELLKKKGIGLENLRLHSTKCTSIINRVIAPSILSDLVEAVGDNKYSVIVDESTDVSRVKWMAMCIRYFNVKKLKIITDFLGLFLVEEATAEQLHSSFLEYLDKVGMKVENIIAIGTDGASNLCGAKKSLFALLKKDNPKLLLMKCTCHSLNLCCSNASKKIPNSVEYVVKELYNYFSQSPLRSVKYKRAFDLINTGNDSNPFRKLVQLSDTRWLAYGLAVKRILEQWVELKYHFSIITTAENDHSAQLIYNELSNDTNRLYLIFLNPILQEMNSLNLKFQSEKVDVGSAYNDIVLTFFSFAAKILKPAFLTKADISSSLFIQVKDALTNKLAFLDLDSVNFGSEFSEEIKNVKLAPDIIITLKQSCFNYLLQLLMEMAKRLPDNILIFQKFDQFSLSRCGNFLTQEKFTLVHNTLKKFLDPKVLLSQYENQWTKLGFVNWAEHFSENLPQNLIDFWPLVYSYKDAAGNFFFKEIAEAVIKMLLIPTSNACVERVFSTMNATKTKLRNRMQYELLEAVLRITIAFNISGICCKDFVPTKNMLERFNSKNMYQTSQVQINENEINDVYETCL